MSTVEKNIRSLKEHYSDFAKCSLYRYLPQTPSYQITYEIPENEENKNLSGWSDFYGRGVLSPNSPAVCKREVVHIVHYIKPSLSKSKRDSELEDAINEAKYIPHLPNNWDEEGAIPISQELFDVTIDFLRTYYLFLVDTKGVKMAVPEINPCRDGTVDLSWRTENARLLINIRSQQDDYLAYFYGDMYNSKMPIKGNVSISNFSESLAVWMKYLV